jgi:hypothetical protein
VKEVNAFLERFFCLQFRHNACPFIMENALFIVEDGSIAIKFLILSFVSGDVSFYVLYA